MSNDLPSSYLFSFDQKNIWWTQILLITVSIFFCFASVIKAGNSDVSESGAESKMVTINGKKYLPVQLVSMHKSWEETWQHLNKLLPKSKDRAHQKKLDRIKAGWKDMFEARQAGEERAFKLAEKNISLELENAQREEEVASLKDDLKRIKKARVELGLTAITCVVAMGFTTLGEFDVIIEAYRGKPEMTYKAMAAGSAILFSGGYEGGIQAGVDGYSKWLFDRDYNLFKSLKKENSEAADSKLRAEFDIFAKRFITALPFTIFIRLAQVGSGTTEISSAWEPVGIIGTGLADGLTYVISSHLFWSYAKWIRTIKRIPIEKREFRANWVNFGLTNIANVAFLVGTMGDSSAKVSTVLSYTLFVSGAALFGGSWLNESRFLRKKLKFRKAQKKLRDKYRSAELLSEKDLRDSTLSSKLNPCSGIF